MHCSPSRELPDPAKGKAGWPWTEERAQLAGEAFGSSHCPKVSIVTPNYNYGHFLEETIRSVLGQGYPNLEYIIIDGGSTDNSVEIIKKYEPWLTYWVSEPDGGISNALNKGFQRTNGEIMAWLNSDDKYLPWTFAVVAEIFRTYQDVNWIVGYNSAWDAAGRQIRVFPCYKNVYNFLLRDYGWIQQESVFWRRSLWERAGAKIDEGYKVSMDGELWSRFFLYDDLWHVETVLGGYRIHDSNRAHKYYDEMVREIKTAIRGLEKNSSPVIRRKLLLLKVMRMMKRAFKGIDIDMIAHALLPRSYQGIHYKALVFEKGRWIKSAKRFIH